MALSKMAWTSLTTNGLRSRDIMNMSVCAWPWRSGACNLCHIDLDLQDATGFTWFEHILSICFESCGDTWILKQAHIAFPWCFSTSAPWHLSWGVALRSEHWHRALLIVHVVLPSDVYWCVGRATCLQHVCNWYRLFLVLYVLLPEELEWFVAVHSFQQELRRPTRRARRLSDTVDYGQ